MLAPVAVVYHSIGRYNTMVLRLYFVYEMWPSVIETHLWAGTPRRPQSSLVLGSEPGVSHSAFFYARDCTVIGEMSISGTQGSLVTVA